jgi:iron-sulfur cluster assembly protein
MEHVGIQSAATVARTEGEGEFQITDAAAVQIRKQIEKRKAEGKPTEAIRIGLRGGGCDGFSYVFEWADKPAGKHDHVLELGAGIRVFIDKKSMLYLRGTTLNFVTGLMGHGFKFENPNVKGSCGCGESVQF